MQFLGFGKHEVGSIFSRDIMATVALKLQIINVFMVRWEKIGHEPSSFVPV